MIAWGFVLGGALLWWIAVWLWCRRPQWLRWWLGLLIPVWVLSPTQVEGFPNDYAPAMIAAFYELLIKPDGNPGAAIATLVIGTLVLSLAVALGYLVLRLFTKHGIKCDHLLRIFRRK